MKLIVFFAILAAVLVSAGAAPVETEIDIVETKDVAVEDEVGGNEVGFFARIRTRFYKMCGCGGGFAAAPSGCFPGATQVATPGGVKAISEVDAGDQVYVVDEEGQVRLDTVYLQAHKTANRAAEYVQIRTQAGRTLSLSREHYVYVGGKMVQGQSVQVGDQVSVLDPSTLEMSSDQVREVTVTRERGVYNPWTLSGHLLTSGVHSSAYSADTRPFSPAALHAIFWPLRQLTKMADITFQGTRLTEGQPEWLAVLECLLHRIQKHV